MPSTIQVRTRCRPESWVQARLEGFVMFWDHYTHYDTSHDPPSRQANPNAHLEQESSRPGTHRLRDIPKNSVAIGLRTLWKIQGNKSSELASKKALKGCRMDDEWMYIFKRFPKDLKALRLDVVDSQGQSMTIQQFPSKPPLDWLPAQYLFNPCFSQVH